MKAGLKDLGDAIKLITSLLHQCKDVSEEVKKEVEEMAEVFSSPWSLVYHIGKNLIVNGVDILKNIELALSEYKAKNYYAFGQAIGKALAEVVLKSPLGEERVKDKYDLYSYYFLMGFASGT